MRFCILKLHLIQIRNSLRKVQKMNKVNRIICISLQIFLLASLYQSLSGYESNNYYPHSYQNYAHSYATHQDSRYFKHGSQQNEVSGGTCNEFLRINTLNTCCSQRDDDCYMIHYDTRCYCDVFCDRSKMHDNSDCCDDAVDTCSGVPTTPRPTSIKKRRLINFSFIFVEIWL